MHWRLYGPNGVEAPVVGPDGRYKVLDVFTKPTPYECHYNKYHKQLFRAMSHTEIACQRHMRPDANFSERVKTIVSEMQQRGGKACGVVGHQMAWMDESKQFASDGTPLPAEAICPGSDPKHSKEEAESQARKCRAYGGMFGPGKGAWIELRHYMTKSRKEYYDKFAAGPRGVPTRNGTGRNTAAGFFAMFSHPGGHNRPNRSCYTPSGPRKPVYQSRA